MIAAYNRNAGIVRTLLDAGFPLVGHSLLDTPLHAAVRCARSHGVVSARSADNGVRNGDMETARAVLSSSRSALDMGGNCDKTALFTAVECVWSFA
jgi:hypothetical protein